jgi:hypothetical protein
LGVLYLSAVLVVNRKHLIPVHWNNNHKESHTTTGSRTDPWPWSIGRVLFYHRIIMTVAAAKDPRSDRTIGQCSINSWRGPGVLPDPASSLPVSS